MNNNLSTIKKFISSNYQTKKLLLEIGIGYGEFFSWLSQNSEYICFGTDMKKNRVEKSLNKLNHSNITGEIIYSNAKNVLRDIFSYQSLDRIIINFPDPWSDKITDQRRFSDKTNIELIISRLKVNGSILLATDNTNYFNEFSNNIIQFNEMDTVFKQQPMKNLYRGFITRYENTWLHQGRELLYQNFTKIKDSEKKFIWDEVNFPDITINKPIKKTIRELNGIIIKSEPVKENKIRIIIVEKKLQISYTLLLKIEEKGKLVLLNKETFIFSSEIKKILEIFFENSGNNK